MHGPNGIGGLTNAAFGNSVWYWEDVHDGNIGFGAWRLNVGPQGMSIVERFKPDFMSFATRPAGAHDMLLR